jgi:ketosteroid isomerase-like protein
MREAARAELETAMAAHHAAPNGGAGHHLGADDRLEILKLQALWTAVVRAGRADRAAELCADDVVVLPPDEAPITGREAARAWLAGLNGGPVDRIEVAGVDLRGGSRTAWLTATVITTRRDAEGEPLTERELRHWALVKDGPTWRVKMAGWEPAKGSGQARSTAYAETGDANGDLVVTRLDGVADAPARRPLFARLMRRN